MKLKKKKIGFLIKTENQSIVLQIIKKNSYSLTCCKDKSN